MIDMCTAVAKKTTNILHGLQQFSYCCMSFAFLRPNIVSIFRKATRSIKNTQKLMDADDVARSMIF